MFETAEIGNEVDKKVFDAQAKDVRARLLQAQKALAKAPFSCVVLVSGVEGAGKSEAVNTLLEWMDARGIQTLSLGEPSGEERLRPSFWRFWRALPAQGRMAVLFGSWYSDPIIRRTFHKDDAARFDQRLERIVEFERMLTQENVLLVKLWLHLSKKQQKRRLQKLSDDPLQSWRVTARDWKFFRKYDRFRAVSERTLLRTGTGEAPWTIIEANDARYRTLTVTKTLLAALEDKLAASSAKKPKVRPDRPVPRKQNVIRELDFGKTISKKAYEKRLLASQGRLSELTRELRERDKSLILVFEGPDAAGKGGAIRRLTQAMDARVYEVTSVGAPNDEERARPYLWRFWRNLPGPGRVTIYDRSWYGRVLVERIEGFCAPEDWRRAYAEINSFEAQIAEHGTVVRKFWLQITADEQLRRFKSREETPYKQYKLTGEDWRNRARWDAYEAAACEMFEKTSTTTAPWILVPANDKQYARVQVLESVVEALEDGL